MGAIHRWEDANYKTVAETVEGSLDAVDIAEVGTKAEDHDGPDGSSLRGAAGDAAISGHRPCVRPMAGDCCVSLAMTMAIILASRLVHQRAHPSHRAFQAGKERLADQIMAEVELVELRDNIGRAQVRVEGGSDVENSGVGG